MSLLQMSAENNKEQPTHNPPIHNPGYDMSELRTILQEESAHETLDNTADPRWDAAMDSLRLRVLQDPKYAPEVLIQKLRAQNQRTRRKTRMAMAAAILVVLGMGIWFESNSSRVQAYPWAKFERKAGAMDPVSFQDGSVAQLNSGSEMKVSLTDSARTVVLENGEVFFDVSYDVFRPFNVDAGSVRLHAVDTAIPAFSVKKGDDGQIKTAVRRGVVEVEAVGSGRPLPGVTAQPPEVKEGEVATIGPDGNISVTPVGRAELADQLAWTNPLHSLDGMTLKDAVDLFNRYNAVKLEVSDHTLGQARLTGSYRLAEPETFVKSLEKLGVRHVLREANSTAGARILLMPN